MSFNGLAIVRRNPGNNCIVCRKPKTAPVHSECGKKYEAAHAEIKRSIRVESDRRRLAGKA